MNKVSVKQKRQFYKAGTVAFLAVITSSVITSSYAAATVLAPCPASRKTVESCKLITNQTDCSSSNIVWKSLQISPENPADSLGYYCSWSRFGGCNPLIQNACTWRRPDITIPKENSQPAKRKNPF